jgi:hypothetical protein
MAIGSVTTSFKTNIHNINANIEAKKADVCKRYNITPEDSSNIEMATAGMTVLSGLGIAMLFKEKLIFMTRRTQRNLKHLFSPEKVDKKVIFPGPDIKFKDEPMGIKNGWDRYIGKVQKRLDKHDEKQKMYDTLFAEHKCRANELATIAKKKATQRGDNW